MQDFLIKRWKNSLNTKDSIKEIENFLLNVQNHLSKLCDLLEERILW